MDDPGDNKAEYELRVAEFLESKEMLDAFMSEHEKLFDTYRALVDDYNQKLDAADKSVRAAGISCGPWDQYQKQVKYDPSAIYDVMGREDFLRVGGTVQTVSQYGLDKAQFEAAAARGEVPNEAIERGKTITPKYKAPKPINL